MSEHAKAIMSTIVVVACLALLGVMVYLHVENAGIAAIGVITTIIAWFARSPDRKDPPPGATIVPLVAAGALLASILACGCSSPPKAVQAETALTTELLACTKESKTVEDSRACESRVLARWGIAEREAGK